MRLLLLLCVGLCASVNAQIMETITTTNNLTFEVVAVNVHKTHHQNTEQAYVDNARFGPGLDVVFRITHKDSPKLIFDPKSLILSLTDNKDFDLLKEGQRKRAIINEVRSRTPSTIEDMVTPGHSGSFIGEPQCEQNTCLVTLHTDANLDVTTSFVNLNAELTMQIADQMKTTNVPIQLTRTQENFRIEGEMVSLVQLGVSDEADNYRFEYYEAQSNLVIFDIRAVDPNTQYYPDIKSTLVGKTYYGLPSVGSDVSSLQIQYAKLKSVTFPLAASITLAGGLVIQQ